MMRILVDIDGTVADWGKRYGELLDEFGEAAANIPRHHEQTSFNLSIGRTVGEKQIIKTIMNDPRFYSELEPIKGAKTALRQMLKAGHDVRFVTSPWVSNPTCASDKLNWVVKHYGAHWGQRVIITTDKTLVKGDILIDDRPTVDGIEEPTWEHVWFRQPYNEFLTGKRRIDQWTEWQEVVESALVMR